MPNLSRESRKAAIEAYKRRKTVGGIYAIRSKMDGAKWVGKAPNLSTVWNRLNFELRSGGCRCQSLQETWKLHGADNLAFEVIEEIDAEELLFAADQIMKERLEHWCAAIPAYRLDS